MLQSHAKRACAVRRVGALVTLEMVYLGSVQHTGLHGIFSPVHYKTLCRAVLHDDRLARPYLRRKLPDQITSLGCCLEHPWAKVKIRAAPCQEEAVRQRRQIQWDETLTLQTWTRTRHRRPPGRRRHDRNSTPRMRTDGREMGALSHLFSICVGAYGGAYFAQNYEIGKVPSITELAKKLESYIQEYKKER